MMRILIVDDSILFRRVMTEVLLVAAEVEVVGQAHGEIAVQKKVQGTSRSW